MELGVHIGQQNMSMDDLRSTWKRFDAAGIDWISVWDHLYEAPPAGGTIDHFEAVSVLGALCADTVNARIGCLVFYVGYRNPALLAKTTFEGDHFRTDDVSNRPLPVQDKLPLWIGGVGEKKTLPLAAKWADGWNAAYVSPGEFARLGGVLDAACERIDRDPASIERTVNLQFVVGTTQAESDRALADTRAFWGPMADRVMDGALVGTPDQVIEQIQAYADAGADGVNIALRAPWSNEAIDAYIEQVLPEFSS